MKYDLTDKKLHKEISPNVWIMNSHEWAFFAWANFYLKHNRISKTLVHIDAHYDACWDVKTSKSIIKLKQADNINKVFDLVNRLDLIKHDFFIAPAII